MSQAAATFELLDSPLEELACLGLARPGHLTVDQFLCVLVQAGLLEAAPVERYLKVFQAVRYGNEDLPLQQLEEVTDLLGGAIQQLENASAEALEQARRKLAPPAPAAQAAPARAPAQPPPERRLSGLIPPLASSPPRSQPQPPLRTSMGAALPSLRFVIPGLLLLLIWSGVMVAFGYSRTERIGEMVQWVRRRGRPVPPPPPAKRTLRQRLDSLQRKAGAAPGNRKLWMNYARLAANTGHWADAIVAYQHVVRRWPNDSFAANNLAWLYLTAGAPYARNRARGLELAERAYALKRAPVIADTLAQACFQDGQLERAVKLQRAALEGTMEHKVIFREKLIQYEEALKARRAR